MYALLSYDFTSQAKAGSMKKKVRLSKNPETEFQVVEWINGEPVSIDEYEKRMRRRLEKATTAMMLRTNPEYRWIYGIH